VELNTFRHPRTQLFPNRRHQVLYRTHFPLHEIYFQIEIAMIQFFDDMLIDENQQGFARVAGTLRPSVRGHERLMEIACVCATVALP
jgi:hypothetical protein